MFWWNLPLCSLLMEPRSIGKKLMRLQEVQFKRYTAFHSLMLLACCLLNHHHHFWFFETQESFFFLQLMNPWLPAQVDLSYQQTCSQISNLSSQIQWKCLFSVLYHFSLCKILLIIIKTHEYHVPLLLWNILHEVKSDVKNVKVTSFLPVACVVHS